MRNTLEINALSAAEKLSLYTRMSAPCLNMEAIFSDETDRFVTVDGQQLTIQIRVAKHNIDAIFLWVNGQLLAMEKTPHPTDNSNMFQYYQAACAIDAQKVEYYFVLHKNNRTYYYNKQGVTLHPDANYHFVYIPGFSTPEWAKGAVMYQIYVDRFCNGDPTNDVKPNEYIYLGQPVKPITDWYKLPETMDVANFYGGDLKGVMDKLSYLKGLGVDVIYFCPIFVSPSNHKYDAQDYDYVDPHFGVIVEDGGEPLSFEKFHNRYATMYMHRTAKKANLEASNQLLIELIQLAHENGMKVILDGVFNHCGAFHKWMDKENFYSGKGYPNGAYIDEHSPYHSFFRWYDQNWPGNDCYDAWWGFDNHPKLHFEASPELYAYIMDIARKWVSPPFNADGWRLDVAADLGYSKAFNHQFWRDFRNAVKEANPNAIVLAEHYGDPKDWLDGTQWDTIMNYDAFMDPLTWFLTGMEKHSEAFREDMLCNAGAFESAMRYQMARFALPSLQISMNQLSNHDHSRFLTRTNRQVGRLHTHGHEAAALGINKSVMMEAVTFQMTWPGAPTLYYGDEASVVGWTDPDNRRTYPWGHEDKVMLAFHKAAIAMHKSYPALIHGSVEFLNTAYGIICYGRFTDENRLVVVLNNNNESKTLNIPVWRIGIQRQSTVERVLLTAHDGFYTKPETLAVENGFLTVTAPPFSSMVFVDKGTL